jgi:hypothetical protein
MSNKERSYLELVSSGELEYLGDRLVEDLKPVDWFEELGAEKNIFGVYSLNDNDNQDWDRLEKLSGAWVTCAVGNQCSVIPRKFDGEPFDSELSDLGVEFHFAIRNSRRLKAFETLLKIEERSGVLIRRFEAEQAGKSSKII